MEEKLTIATPDDHLIYGVLHYHETKKDKLIIFCHGLSGNMDEHHYFNAVPYFTPKGYDVFRFNFYSRESKARQFSECSISIHGQDINSVIEKFKDSYEELYLVGHSLGCLAILGADTSHIKKIIYWDPAKGCASLEDNYITFNEQNGLYTFHWGLEFSANETFIKEYQEMVAEVSSQKITSNSSFIFSGKSGNLEVWEKYVQDYDYRVVENATHVFVEEGCEKQLFDYTLELLESGRKS